MRYFCSLPNPGTEGHPKFLLSDDDALIARWVEAENRPGRGVYYCPNRLKQGATRHGKENIGAVSALFVDVDCKHIEEQPEEIEKRLRNLLLTPTWVVRSGHGYHVGWELKEPIGRDDPEFEEVLRLQAALIEYLAGDPQVRVWSLLRLPGTLNTKSTPHVPCEEMLRCSPVDLTEIRELVEISSAGTPLLTRNGREVTDDTDNNIENKPPVDVDARLAAMRFQGAGDSAINITQTQCIASLLAQGIGLEETVRTVLEATRACVSADELSKWDWLEEEKQIWQSGLNFITKDSDRLADRVPDYMRETFNAAIASHKRPTACFRKDTGWHIRGYTPTLVAGTDVLASGTAGVVGTVGAVRKPAAGRVFAEPRPFVPFDVTLLPPRSWLYGKHYQRRTVSLTAGPGGMGKSSLDMVEFIAMATCRNLLGEQPEERLRVWYHNGDDPRDEVNRRLAAVCQHYKIPMEELQGWLWTSTATEFPLKVAKGYANLEIDDALVRHISAFIGKNQIDVAGFDPLVSVHSVSEMDTGKMDAVVRVFGEIADENDAAIELAHHVRKPAVGTFEDYDVHDIRGVKAITDAVRAARILNHMKEKDAEAAGCSEMERLTRFRVDRAKGNYSSPAQIATWRQFISVELANGDDVGVVAPWNYPGQGEQTPEKIAADQRADQVFLLLLTKFTARGTNVSSNVGSSYAPAKFADEREAKAAKVSKAALKGAMTRLFDAGRIKSEPSRADGRSHRLVRTDG